MPDVAGVLIGRVLVCPSIMALSCWCRSVRAIVNPWILAVKSLAELPLIDLQLGYMVRFHSQADA
jgi:hypothetical protein